MKERYIRQTVIPEIGTAGQVKLRRARVLVIGAGGLGSPNLLYLAAAGIGTLGIVDDDKLNLSNLNRQILYATEDLGRSKALAAVQRARTLNPEVKIIPYEERFLRGNGLKLVRDYDLVIEASDNLETKALVNELCVDAKLPQIWGAVARFEGQMGTYIPGHTCRACIFPTIPERGTYPTPAELGIVGAVAGVIASMQALEAIKVILDIGQPLTDQILLWDGLYGSFDRIEIARSPTCPVCGQ